MNGDENKSTSHDTINTVIWQMCSHAISDYQLHYELQPVRPTVQERCHQWRQLVNQTLLKPSGEEQEKPLMPLFAVL